LSPLDPLAVGRQWLLMGRETHSPGGLLVWFFASGNVLVHGHPGEHDSGLLVIADLPSVDSFARYLRTYGYEPRWSQKKMPSVIKTCELSRFEFFADLIYSEVGFCFYTASTLSSHTT
jgi:hypothetical protein